MSVSVTRPDISKLEPLDGTNFKRWSQKLLIYFEQLDVDYVLFQNPPETPADTSVLAITPSDTSMAATAKSEDEAKQKFDRDNKTVRGHLLNHMNNSLFDLFVSHKSAKDIWTTLETRYGGDDAGRKKYVVGKWLQFQMVDERPIMDQIHEYENLVTDVLSEGMKMCEILQANVLLEKFPPTWSEYRNHLKHKKRDLTLQELISHMRTEEANRLKDKETSLSTLSVKANLVESAGSKDRFHQNKGKKFQKNNQHKPFKAPDGKIQKNKLVCYCCGKIGHKAYQCYQRKDHQKANQKPATQGTPQVNLAEKDDEIIAAVVVEANLVENKEDWILDTGASRHFCSNKALFHELLETTDGDCVFMGNSTTAGVAGKGYLSDGLFVLNTVPTVFNKTTSSSAYMIESYDVWHGRLGRVNYSSIKRLKKAKYAKKPFKSVTSRSTELLELIHSDLADFKNSLSKGGKKYYVSFGDDFSRYTKIYLLKSKDEAVEIFLKFKVEAENQLDKKIKRIRSDRGGEYNTKFLKDFCENNGIIHETSAPYTPQQNGIAEWKNRTLKEMMNAMLLSSGMPDNMWGEAVLTACYILNRVPHKKLNKTPYELWKRFAPNFNHLKVWGCLAKVAYPDFKKSNIGPKTFDCVFIGYAQNSAAAYRFMCLSDNSLCKSRDAEFFELVFPLNKTTSMDLASSSNKSVETSSNSSVNELRRSKRQRTEHSFGPDFLTAFLTEDLERLNEEFVSMFLVENDPKTYTEAITSIDSSFWKEAIRNELDSIMLNHTWDLVDLPIGSKPIKCKWVF
ncbi:UNVERIFIED_CONTAM: Retrovirus-related Pol polyprotein from transposon TNT 1-94 [Sesamum radiatum]|uniref:Retrovirus-related Pol polyprotein from transposon TNT 1-94 n=1 Tax=Sesamum radiatum TaxID=300843 RepID=A0AAW2THY6_SESRA